MNPLQSSALFAWGGEVGLFFGQVDSQTLFPILAAVGIATFVFGAYTLFARGDQRANQRLERFSKVIDLNRGDRADSRQTNTDRLKELLERAAPAIASPLKPSSEKEANELKKELMYAGFRGESAPTVYLGVKFGFLLFGLFLSFALVIPYFESTRDRLQYGFILTGGMFYVPGMVLGQMKKKRQEQVFLGLPDALDLMTVCVEAGLGLDAAMRKVAEEMNRTFPVISEEFSICNFQLQMGRPRREVLHDLGARTGVDDMKALAAILIQADRFGSSIAQALRTQSDSMRVRRRQIAEEKAAQTAVKLLLPLVLFIFPAVFIVLVGPAAIKIGDAFK
ncbi:MAG: type II secretion system F family protein [Planctomycetia bacterium]